MRNAGLEEAQAGIKIARRNINNLRYADDTTLMTKSEEELKKLIQAFNEQLSGYGVTYAQWRFLITLWETDGVTQKALSQHAGIEPATTVRTLDRMERDGLIQRVRSSTDRREINIFLAEKGKGLHEDIQPLAIKFESLMVSGLESSEVASVKNTLNHILNQLPQKP